MENSVGQMIKFFLIEISRGERGKSESGNLQIKRELRNLSIYKLIYLI